MYKPLLRKTQAIILSLTMVFAVLSVPYSVPVKAANSAASVIAEWDTTYQTMDGVGAAFAFTDSLGMMQLAEAGYQDIVQHLLDLAFDDAKGVGFDIVRVIIGDNGSIAPTGTSTSPGFNPVTGLLADVNNPGYDIEGNPIPTWGTTGQYGYKPGYNRYYDGNTDSIWPNEPEHEPGTLVPLTGFIWDYDSWKKPIPKDDGGPTNLVNETGDPVVIKGSARTRKEIFDIDQIWTMKQAMKYEVDTFYACMWTAPYWMCRNYTPSKIIRDDTAVIDGKTVKIYYLAYADYLVYYIKGLWEQWGIPITHICPFNEGDLQGGSAQYVKEIINDYVGPTLKKALEPGGALYGIKNPEGKEIDFAPQLCAPDGTNLNASISRGGEAFSYTDPATALNKNPYLDVFTTHLYGTVEIGTDETKLYHRGDFAVSPLDYTSNPSKYPEYLTKYKLWQTEFMNQDTADGSAGAYTNRYGNQNIFDAVRYSNLITNMFCSNPGFSAYIWWSMWDNNGVDGSDLIRFVNNNAQQNPGRISTLTGHYRIFKRFYGLGHLSRFMEPGDIRFEVTRQPVEDINIVGFKSKDNDDFSITITNAGNDDSIQTLEFTLKNFPVGTTSVTVFRTSASENMKKIGTIPVKDGKFTVDIPSASIVTIVPSGGTYATYEGLDDERDIFSSLKAEDNDNGVEGKSTGMAGRENEAVVLNDGDFDTATSASTENWFVGRYNNGKFELNADSTVLASSEVQRYTGFSRYLKNSRTSANAASVRLSNRIDAQDQYDGIWQDVTGKMKKGERYRFEGYFLSMQNGALTYEVAADKPGDVKAVLVYYDAEGNQLDMTAIGERDMPEPLAAREAGEPCYWESNRMVGEILEGGPLALSSFQAASVKVANWHESDSDPFIYSEPEGTARVVLAVYAEDSNILYCDLLSIAPEPDRDSLRSALKNYTGNNVNLINIVKEAIIDSNLTQSKVNEMITALKMIFTRK